MTSERQFDSSVKLFMSPQLKQQSEQKRFNVRLLLNEHEFIQMHSSLGQTFGDIKCDMMLGLPVAGALAFELELHTGHGASV